MTPAVDIQEVSFAYKSKAGPVKALSSVNLVLEEETIYGLLGPNGAGKTTLIRCLTGLLVPDSGSVHVSGGIPGRKNLGRVGVLIENPGIYRKLSAAEYLGFFAGLYRIKNASEVISRLAELFQVKLSAKPLGKLSMGQRQKIQLIRSLMHAPKLILWDEPFSNLDPHAQGLFQKHLEAYIHENRATAIIATHQLNQAEHLCTSFGFLNNGAMAYSGGREEINGKASAVMRVKVEFGDEIDRESLTRLARNHELTLETTEENNNESIVQAGFSGPGLGEKIPELIMALAEMKIKIRSVIPEKKDLYDLYEEMVRI
ncbi:ABC transporter ATP-binding protein [Fibrobacterota bacterium]